MPPETPRSLCLRCSFRKLISFYPTYVDPLLIIPYHKSSHFSFCEYQFFTFLTNNKIYRPNFKQKRSFPFFNSAATSLMFSYPVLNCKLSNYPHFLLSTKTVDLKLCSQEDVEGSCQGL